MAPFRTVEMRGLAGSQSLEMGSEWALSTEGSRSLSAVDNKMAAALRSARRLFSANTTLILEPSTAHANQTKNDTKEKPSHSMLGRGPGTLIGSPPPLLICTALAYAYMHHLRGLN